MTRGGADSDSSSRIGAIDIGTNSVLLLIAEERRGELVQLADLATVTRLGEGVDRTRRLAPEATQRTLACLAAYKGELHTHAVPRLGVVGTSALRDAEGGEDFLSRAEAILGLRPAVIPGVTEAQLTFEGALSGLQLEGPVCVFDVGGGSTEVISGVAGSGQHVARAISLDIGSVRLFERHAQSDPPSRAEIESAVADIENALALAPKPDPRATLVGVAGTVTTLAAIALGLERYDGAHVHGHVLERSQVFAIANQLSAVPLRERLKLSGLEPRRADLIVMGAEIVRRVLLWADAPKLMVSDRGVRWGIAHRLAANRSFTQ